MTFVSVIHYTCLNATLGINQRNVEARVSSSCFYGRSWKLECTNGSVSSTINGHPSRTQMDNNWIPKIKNEKEASLEHARMLHCRDA
jgi:hypothetical protein